MNKNDQAFAVQHIRAQYVEKQSTDLEELKKLDTKVKRPATVLAYVFGSIAALVMGTGMSLVMTDLGNTLGISNGLVPGVAIGVVGILMAIVNYFMYKGILKGRKKKYAAEILALSDKIIAK